MASAVRATRMHPQSVHTLISEASSALFGITDCGEPVAKHLLSSAVCHSAAALVDPDIWHITCCLPFRRFVVRTFSTTHPTSNEIPKF